MDIIKWIDYEDASPKADHGLGGLGGFFKNGMRWKDYLDIFKDKAHPDLEILRASIIKNNIKCNGSEHQNGFNAVPVWEDGSCDTYTFRSWGDLMAAVWSTEENEDYSYMDFYC